MSSEVQAKWMNSSARCASAFFASFERSQSSIALTSWLVSASMFLMCSASRSEKLLTREAKFAAVFGENGFSSLIGTLGRQRLEPFQLDAHAVADEGLLAEVGAQRICALGVPPVERRQGGERRGHGPLL